MTFFLSAIIETAGKGKQTFQDILKLRHEVDSLIVTYGKRAENAQKLVKLLYRKPAITITSASQYFEISHQSASSLITKLTSDGLLQETTGYQRNKVFYFSKYLLLFED